MQLVEATVPFHVFDLIELPHDPANLTGREAAAPWMVGVRKHMMKVRSIQSDWDAFRSGLWPAARRVCFCQRCNRASLPLAKSCRNSAQPRHVRPSGLLPVSGLSALDSGLG
jgi:hypothetical protein